MSKISELEMSLEFEKSVRESAFFSFDTLHNEVTCKQGIADFVGVKKYVNASFISVFNNFSSIESESLILSLLKKNAPRSKEYLISHTGLSEKTVSRVLNSLLKANLVTHTDSGLFLSNIDNQIDVDIWAFELKLSNWKRALFQALQYKSFSNYSIVVFPLSKRKTLVSNLNMFITFNVGVLLFDDLSGSLEFLFAPKREKANSKWDVLYVLAQLARF